MGFAQKKDQNLNETEYLSLERDAEYKSEFYNGEIFAMAGASRNHNIITGNLSFCLKQALTKNCYVYSSDMRLKIQKKGLYTYPDILVTCDNEDFADEHMDTLLNPKLIIEVLSKSTESYDRGKKFEMYRSLDSLLEYVLVSQLKPHVEHYIRQENGKWLFSEYMDIHSSITLLGIEIKMSDIYENITRS